MLMTASLIARCADTSDGELAHLALAQVSFTGATPPEWVELIPAGPEVDAFDGRKFRNSKPEEVVARFRGQPLHLPIDYEHSSEIKAPKGDEAPAAGWITGLEVRAGSVWGKVEWTPRGIASLSAKEYRYISPAFRHDKAGNVLQLVSAGLTNKPALNLTALASQGSNKNADGSAAKAKEFPTMEPEILKALGLDEKATKEQVVAACAALKASADAKSKAESELATARNELVKAQTPDLNKFVPRAEYETACARAEDAEKQIADSKAVSFKKEVDAEIDAALKAGKITPATKDFYVSTCATAEGLEKFRAFAKAAAPVGGGNEPVITKKVDENTASLDEAQLAVCRTLGITPEQYLASVKSISVRK